MDTCLLFWGWMAQSNALFTGFHEKTTGRLHTQEERAHISPVLADLDSFFFFCTKTLMLLEPAILLSPHSLVNFEDTAIIGWCLLKLFSKSWTKIRDAAFFLNLMDPVDIREAEYLFKKS